MFGFLGGTLRSSARVILNSSNSIENVSLLIVRVSSSSSKKTSKVEDQQQKHSFTVSYFVNSCGLPLQATIAASQKVHFESSERPDSVLGFLKNHGFTDTQITKLIKVIPRLVFSDTEKTLRPKVEFFNSVGISGPDFTRILCHNPNLWHRSVDKHLLPCYDYIKSVLLSDDEVVRAWKASPRMISWDLQKHFVSNLELLRKFGMTQSNISLLMTSCPSILLSAREKFDKQVKEVFDMGFYPKKSNFVHALKVICGLTKLTLERKKEVFRRSGWSEDEILSVFRKHPYCMSLSVKKLTSGLDFMMNKMGWHREAVARIPSVLCYSLSKRIIPRCSVVEVLLSKELLKEDLCLSTVLIPPERKFLEMFVMRYEEQVPQLLNVYEGKMGLRE